MITVVPPAGLTPVTVATPEGPGVIVAFAGVPDDHVPPAVALLNSIVDPGHTVAGPTIGVPPVHGSVTR